jgi:hypothetical protein
VLATKLVRSSLAIASREGMPRAPIFAMRSARHTVALFLVTAFGTGVALFGCSDADPNYGKPESIRGRTINYGTPVATTPTDGGTSSSGGGAKTPQDSFNVLYDGATVADGIKTTCTPCHATGGNGVTLFIAGNAADAYKVFQASNFKDLTLPKPKGFFTKGAHTGPALTTTQEAAAKAWSQAEIAAGGSTPIADAGGGG